MTDDKTRAECEEWVQKSIKKEHDPIDINDVYAAWQAAKELYAPREGMVMLSLKSAEMLEVNVCDQLRKSKGGTESNRLASSITALSAAILEAKALTATKEPQ